jgi:hypothetical protein
MSERMKIAAAALQRGFDEGLAAGRKLRYKEDRIYDLVQDLIQADSEHGAAWLNEEYGKKFIQEWPEHAKIIRKLAEEVSEWGPE